MFYFSMIEDARVIVTFQYNSKRIITVIGIEQTARIIGLNDQVVCVRHDNQKFWAAKTSKMPQIR